MLKKKNKSRFVEENNVETSSKVTMNKAEGNKREGTGLIMVYLKNTCILKLTVQSVVLQCRKYLNAAIIKFECMIE